MLLDLRTWLVKERVAFVKLTDTYDIVDPQTGTAIAVAKEEPEAWAKWLRLIVKKGLMPTTINVYEGVNPTPVLSIRRGVAFLRPKVTVTAAGGQAVGHFVAKAFSLGGAFRMFDAQGTEIGMVKGDWKGWNFTMSTPSGQEIGKVTKKWAGLGKEFFTTADNYVIALTDGQVRPNVAPLLLAAGIAIDTVYKEQN